MLVFAFSAYSIAFALNNEESKQSVPSISEGISPNGETGALEEHYPIKGYSERRGERTDKWTEEQRGFYFEINNKCMETIVPIAKQMSEKRWENIYCHQVIPEKYDEWGIYLTAEEEYAEYLLYLEGSVNGFYIVIPVVFTPECPDGKITRVIYT